MDSDMTSNVTKWNVETSELFDLVCLTGILSGDPFYINLYPEDYKRLEPRLDAETRQSLGVIDRIIKGLGGAVPAVVCDAASQTGVKSLADLATALEPEDFGEGLDALKEAIIATALGFVRAGFEEDWRRQVQPIVEPHLAPLRDYVRQFDIVPTIEGKLGFGVSNEITVYVLNYNKPHGMRLAGSTFVTHWSYPHRQTLGTAIHELMHPPFDWAKDDDVRAAFEPLRSDTYFMDKVHNHNPSFGYNDFEGFVEEDVIQALDQLLDEDLTEGADEPRKRWRESDDGMHVLAVALYSQMSEDGFGDSDLSLREYLIDLGRRGVIRPGWIERLHRDFYA